MTAAEFQARDQPMRYLDRYYVVSDGLQTATLAEVAEVEARLGLTFPDGYAEFVTELGWGTLSDYLRIWLPREVEKELPEHRKRLSGEFFWDRGGPLSPARAGETVLLGDTMDGDMLVVHPDRPDNLFVLPRHRDEIYRVGPGLDAAIAWLLDSGVLRTPMQLRYFEPPGDRERVERTIRLPYDEVRDALVALGLHDHVAFEERLGAEEKGFELKVKVGNRYVDVDDEEAMIVLLVREFGGDVTASTGSPTGEPDTTDVTITHVPGVKGPKLDRLIAILNGLDARAAKSKRRRWG